MSNPVVHFEVVGKDGQALQRFYHQAFGWNMQPIAEGYAMAFPGGETGINGGIGTAPDGGAGHVSFYVEVDDLHSALSEISRLGGRTVIEPMDVSDGPSIAMFADPEGHIVGLARADTRRTDS